MLQREYPPAKFVMFNCLFTCNIVSENNIGSFGVQEKSFKFLRFFYFYFDSIEIESRIAIMNLMLIQFDTKLNNLNGQTLYIFCARRSAPPISISCNRSAGFFYYEIHS